MTTSNTLSNVQVSLMRFCTDFAAAHSGFTFVNFDAHADETTVPDGDLIGPSGLSLQFSGKLVEIKVMIGLATFSDTNLFRLNNTMGEMLELLRPEQRLRVYDSETGVDVGWMLILDGTQLLPVGGSAGRPLQYVMIDLVTSLNFEA